MVYAAGRDAHWASDPVAFATEGLGLHLSRDDIAILRDPTADDDRQRRRQKQRLIRRIERAIERRGGTVIPPEQYELRSWHPAFWLSVKLLVLSKWLVIVANAIARFSERLAPHALKKIDPEEDID